MGILFCELDAFSHLQIVFHLLWLKVEEVARGPLNVPSPPVVNADPQLRIGLKLLGNARELIIVRLLLAIENLPRVEELGLGAVVSQLGADFARLRRDMFEVVDVCVLVELAHNALDAVDAGEEFILLALLLRLEALAFGQHSCFYLGRRLLDLFRPPVGVPFVGKLVVAQLTLRTRQQLLGFSLGFGFRV